MEENKQIDDEEQTEGGFVAFLKEWWVVIAVALLMLLSRIFIWSSIRVEGHSMDPTLEDKERMIMLNTKNFQRYDIVVATYPDDPKKKVIKRVIGLPGEEVSFKNDQLYINGKKYPEPYLDKYKKKFAEDRLQQEYSYSSDFQKMARFAVAFTIDKHKDANFKVKVPKDHYFLMGDNRVISKDSRAVGPIDKKKIEGEVKFTFWPPKLFGFVKKVEAN